MNSRKIEQLPMMVGLILLCVCVLSGGLVFLVAFDKDAAFFYNRGVRYHDAGNLKLAIENYSTAIKLNPDYAAAYYKRGDACHGIGEPELAVRDYKKYLALAPNAPNRDEVTNTIEAIQSELIP